MNQNTDPTYNSPSGSDSELAQPSVIVDMPEVAKAASHKRMITISAWLLGGIAFVVLAVLIIFQLLGINGAGNKSNKKISLVVKVNPPSAVVDVNGDVLKGNPPTLKIVPSDEYKSIRIKAAGYETIVKDIKIEKSLQLNVKLRKINRREDDNSEEEEFLVKEIKSDEMADIATETVLKERSGHLRSRRHRSRNFENSKERKKQINKNVVELPMQKSADSRHGRQNLTPNAQNNPAYGSKQIVSANKKATNNSAAANQAAEDKPDRGTVTVRVPQGTTSPILVSIDGKKRGNAPITAELKVGLHELVFDYQGKKIFRMVNVKPGQQKRIIPKFD
jgi:hypothetical protein